MTEEVWNEAWFRWVTVDPASILGDERPLDLSALLAMDDHVWRDLYHAWLAELDPLDVPKFQHIAEVEGGQVPRGTDYTKWRAVLDQSFNEFYDEVGRLKKLFKSQSEDAQRIVRLIANTSAVTAKGASKKPHSHPKAAAAQGVAPPRSEPPNLNEFAASTASAVDEFLSSEHLTSYVSWGWQLVGQLEWFGGEVGTHLARISALMEEVTGWRQNAQSGVARLQAALAAGPPAALPEAVRSARESAHRLACHLDLLGYTANGEAPHQTVGRIVADLAEQEAFFLSALVTEQLGELLRGLDALYFYASGALDAAAAVFQLEDPNYHADNLTDWGEPQVATLRAEVTEIMSFLESLPWAEEPYEAEEALAVRYFGRSLTDLYS